ncbi:MAG: cell division protein FtsL [Thiomicrorhabdus sp.]|nr:cell division protein FtsL [Thiomicrorhabdus sp.]
MARELKESPKPTHLKVNKWRGLFLFILVLLVVGSLVAISNVEHQVRALESQYYQSLKQALKANEEWGKLRLEKEHLTAPARVEHIAKTELNMTLDKSNYQTIYLMPVSRESSRAQERKGE